MKFKPCFEWPLTEAKLMENSKTVTPKGDKSVVVFWIGRTLRLDLVGLFSFLASLFDFVFNK